MHFFFIFNSRYASGNAFPVSRSQNAKGWRAWGRVKRQSSQTKYILAFSNIYIFFILLIFIGFHIYVLLYLTYQPTNIICSMSRIDLAFNLCSHTTCSRSAWIQPLVHVQYIQMNTDYRRFAMSLRSYTYILYYEYIKSPGTDIKIKAHVPDDWKTGGPKERASIILPRTRIRSRHEKYLMYSPLRVYERYDTILRIVCTKTFENPSQVLIWMVVWFEHFMIIIILFYYFMHTKYSMVAITMDSFIYLF